MNLLRILVWSICQPEHECLPCLKHDLDDIGEVFKPHFSFFFFFFFFFFPYFSHYSFDRTTAAFVTWSLSRYTQSGIVPNNFFSLQQAPCIQMQGSCKHIYHLSCVKDKVTVNIYILSYPATAWTDRSKMAQRAHWLWFSNVSSSLS